MPLSLCCDMVEGETVDPIRGDLIDLLMCIVKDCHRRRKKSRVPWLDIAMIILTKQVLCAIEMTFMHGSGGLFSSRHGSRQQ